MNPYNNLKKRFVLAGVLLGAFLTAAAAFAAAVPTPEKENDNSGFSTAGGLTVAEAAAKERVNQKNEKVGPRAGHLNVDITFLPVYSPDVVTAGDALRLTTTAQENQGNEVQNVTLWSITEAGNLTPEIVFSLNPKAMSITFKNAAGEQETLSAYDDPARFYETVAKFAAVLDPIYVADAGKKAAKDAVVAYLGTIKPPAPGPGNSADKKGNFKISYSPANFPGMMTPGDIIVLEKNGSTLTYTVINDSNRASDRPGSPKTTPRFTYNMGTQEITYLDETGAPVTVSAYTSVGGFVEAAKKFAMEIEWSYRAGLDPGIKKLVGDAVNLLNGLASDPPRYSISRYSGTFSTSDPFTTIRVVYRGNNVTITVVTAKKKKGGDRVAVLDLDLKTGTIKVKGGSGKAVSYAANNPRWQAQLDRMIGYLGNTLKVLDSSSPANLPLKYIAGLVDKWQKVYRI